MAISFKLIRNFNDFPKLYQPWNELVSECDVDHAFMKHEWFACWIRNLGHPEDLAIQTAWVDGQMVGAAPMQIRSEKIKSIPIKVMSFLASSVSPRCNFIIHPSIESRQIFDALFRVKGWDLISTMNLETGMKTTRDYIEYLDSSYWKHYDKEPGRQSPHQIMDGTWEDYLEKLSKNHRKNVKVAFKRLDGAASHSFEQYESFEEAERVFDHIVAISGASWKAATGSDLRSNKKIESFYRDFSLAGSKLGLWKLYMLKINDKYAAFDYLLQNNKRLTGIRSDYDLTFKEFMPGHLMKIATIKDLCSKKEPWEYDMGGMAADYKMSYAKEIREHIHITACSRGVYGNLVLFGKKNVWPMMKKWKRSKATVVAGEEAGNN